MPKLPPTPKQFSRTGFQTYATLPADDKPAPDFVPVISTAALTDTAESTAKKPGKES